MASSTGPSGYSTLQDDDIIQQLNQYKNDLNNSIKTQVEKLIREDDHLSTNFLQGSISKTIIMKTLMDFAAESSNIEDFADMIGDITMNLPDLNSLDETISAILQAQQFNDFVKNLLEVFKENLGMRTSGGDVKFEGEELIEEIGQTVADYIAELAVDFVKDRVMNEEIEDNDDQ